MQHLINSLEYFPLGENMPYPKGKPISLETINKRKQWRDNLTLEEKQKIASAISKALTGKPKSKEHRIHTSYSKTKNKEIWKFARRNNRGYIFITLKPGVYVQEHIYIMEKHIGRRLLNNEVVHHIDSNRSNNHIENLQLMTRSAHISLHHKGKKQTEESNQKNRLAHLGKKSNQNQIDALNQGRNIGYKIKRGMELIFNELAEV